MAFGNWEAKALFWVTGYGDSVSPHFSAGPPDPLSSTATAAKILYHHTQPELESCGAVPSPPLWQASTPHWEVVLGNLPFYECRFVLITCLES